jgi:hypothetical protein
MKTFYLCHSDSIVGIDGYRLYRQDRTGRKGGGVALYVRSTLQSSVWTYSADDRKYELQWVRVGDVFVAALYHQPRPLNQTDSLLVYIEACVDEISRDLPTSLIVIAGVLNQLSDQDIVERTGFMQIVQQPTRGASIPLTETVTLTQTHINYWEVTQPPNATLTQTIFK